MPAVDLLLTPAVDANLARKIDAQARALVSNSSVTPCLSTNKKPCAYASFACLIFYFNPTFILVFN